MTSQTGRIIPGHAIYRASQRLSKHLKDFGYTNKSLRFLPCNFQCPTVELPEPLDVAAIRVLRDERANLSQLSTQSQKLHNLLWMRQLPNEDNMIKENYARLQSQKRFKVEEASTEEESESSEMESSSTDKISKLTALLEEQATHMKKEQLQKEVAMIMKQWDPIKYQAKNAHLYMIARLAPNFAVSLRVLFEIRKRIPKFAPETALDFGSGLGTVSWALNLIWPVQWKEILMVDASAAMHEISARLMRGGKLLSAVQAAPCFPGIYQRRFLPCPSSESPSPDEEADDRSSKSRMQTYDLVVAQYSLLDAGYKLDRQQVLKSLWNKVNPKGFLVLIEQGTKAGFEAILEARDLLIVDNHRNVRPAHIFAPCPHSFTCPKKDSICNFYVDYKPFSLTKEITESKKELFSYLILSPHDWKEEDQSGTELPRIVSYKLFNNSPKSAIQDLCTPQGEFQRVVFPKNRCDKDLYFYMRRALVGDQAPVEGTVNNEALIGDADALQELSEYTEGNECEKPDS